MLLSEIFEQLSYGELSQIGLGTGEPGTITEENYGRILVHINLGLSALYRRFYLKENRFTLNLQEGKYAYQLNNKYAVSNLKSKEPVKYIDDTETKFLNDIVKVVRVYSDTGYEYFLNDIENDLSIITPTVNTLRVPKQIVDKDLNLDKLFRTDNLQVYYQAAHVPIVDNGMLVPEVYEVELPYTHLEALLLFVASRVNNPIGLGQEFNAGNTYAAKYEAECQRLELLNMQVDIDSRNTRLITKGFV